MAAMRAALAALALAAAGGAASAATMTFDSLPDESGGTVLVEDGITATAVGGELGYHTLPGTAHLDDANTQFARRIRFTMGTTFDALSFDLFPVGYGFFDCEDARCANLDFRNVRVRGFRDGERVARATFEMFDAAGTVLLGPAFKALDRLVIDFRRYPAFVNEDELFLFCNDFCSHYNIDNVTLAPVDVAPVPLPATGAALALGLAALGAAGAARRRRG